MSKLTMHAVAVPPFTLMLGTLTHLFEKAEEASRVEKVDLTALVRAKLAPDMYPFSLQVLLACHHADAAIAALTGEEAPPLPRDDKTFEELKARVGDTARDLLDLPPAKLEGAEARIIRLPLTGDLSFEATGLEFLRDWALPHFYFHVVTAYDILRNAGVDLGKRDFMHGVGRYIRGR